MVFGRVQVLSGHSVGAERKGKKKAEKEGSRSGCEDVQRLSLCFSWGRFTHCTTAPSVFESKTDAAALHTHKTRRYRRIFKVLQLRGDLISHYGCFLLNILIFRSVSALIMSINSILLLGFKIMI